MDQHMLQGLFSFSNSEQHTQALEYLQRLKESRDAWTACSSALATNGLNLDDKAKFICLQILVDYAKTDYATATTEQQHLLRQYLLQWMVLLSNRTDPDKVFVRNKTAQVLSLVFTVDYISRWPTFMDEMLALLQYGTHAVDLYLKILLAIDAELCDREVLHSQVKTDTNNLIKDKMRDRCVVDMVNSWFDILVKYQTSNPEIVCHCHDVIGAYISWIDINLIANERFVVLLVQHLNIELLREAAAECILEIVLKGMEPMAKVQLIETFYNLLDNAGILKPVDDTDSDYLVKLSKLVDGIGGQLISSWHKLDKNDEENRNITLNSINAKVPLLLQFLASEYDDVSSAVLEFSRDYIQLIKQIGRISPLETAHLESMLHIIINKTKFDESYSFTQGGEDEVMFDDYRKSLKVVFDNLAQLVPELVLRVSKDYIVTTLNRWQASPYEDVEAAVSLLYNLGEAIPANRGNYFAVRAQEKTSPMSEMMELLITSGVSGHTHPAVSSQFFECVTRYEKFFSSEPQHIPNVFMAFLGPRGMRNPSGRVRSRTAYLFSRVIRCLKTQLTDYTEWILTQLNELLILPAPNEEEDPDPLLTKDDQLNIFEAASVLIVAGNWDVGRKEQLLRSILSPVLSRVTFLVTELAQEQNPKKQAAIASLVCHATSVTARTTRGFSNQCTMTSFGCERLYLDALQLFINCLNVGVEKETIGCGLRHLMHRLVVCLDCNNLLQMLLPASQALLHMPSTTSLIDYIPLINQIITKFKDAVRGFVKEIFIPLVSAIFTSLSEQLDDNEEEEKRLKKTLQRSYYLFLTTIVANNLIGIITELEPNILHQVLMSVVQGSVEFLDPVAQKNCFVIMRRLTEIWTEKDAYPQFVEFIYTQVVPACFEAPLRTTFDLNDAQSIQALHESAMCLHVVYAKRGDEFLNYLRSDFFIKKALAPDIVNDFCNALTSDALVFRNYTKIFFQRAKS